MACENGKAMIDLYSRWKNDSYFVQMLNLALEREQLDSVADLREWFKTAPKTASYAVDREYFDFRCIDISGSQLGDVSLAYLVLDGARASGCRFEGTSIQRSAARNSNFSSSQFIVAQLSPMYAQASNFSNCKFISTFAQGAGPRDLKDVHGIPIKGTYSDFRDCDFSNVRAQKTGFDRCDFRNADFTGAQFERCIFSESDLQGVLASNTQFIDCDLQGALIDDTPTWRSMLSVHTNLNTEKIVWTPI